MKDSISQQCQAHIDTTTRRRALLEQLQRILPVSKHWQSWLTKTGELPPDFTTLPVCTDLPDPLMRQVDHASVPIVSADEWEEQRQHLLAQFHYWLLGTVPPSPASMHIETLDEQRENDVTIRKVRLSFGEKQQASLRLELLIPPIINPAPVFLTQHTHRAWALIALRRGYIGCVYAGSDELDDTDTYLAAYPAYDWSRLTRRAWSASRCVDYLITLPQVNTQQIAITGHSRNGKQSLIATALDQRIALVIASSAGAGGVLPTRYYSEQAFGEGIEPLTRVFPEWFHPRLRFFVGREHYLPVDMHELIALSAPRPCLLAEAYNDNCGNPWALQQSFEAARRVYSLLGAEGKLEILWRPGGHETHTTDIERYLDWCDLHFRHQPFTFSRSLPYPHDWNAWQAQNEEQAHPHSSSPYGLAEYMPASLEAWKQRRGEIRHTVQQFLGDAPPLARNEGDTYGVEEDHVSALLVRDQAGDGVERERIICGEYINSDLYLPAGLKASGRRVPVVLWLAPFHTPHGYRATYTKSEQIFRILAREGFAVFCMDPIGSGRRILEAQQFYQRHPRWSLLGKMVRDIQAALDVLPTLPYVDTAQIWGLGYGVGCLVGLHLGAVDERLSGLALVAPSPPFRTDTDSSGTGGIRCWSHRDLLLPQLGFFVGQEERVPYDGDDLYACLAPRPLLVISPQLDREAPLENVSQAVMTARRVYKLFHAEAHIQQLTPETYHQFGTADIQQMVVTWLKRITL